MEWTIKLEARTGWGEVTTYEIRALHRSLGDLTADGVGMSLAEAKALLAEVQQKIVQSQIDEYVTCARVCPNCMKLRPLRDQRSRTLQTLFGTVKVAAPRIRLCACADTLGMHDVSLLSLSYLLPDRCTAELRRLQAELGARHSFREATRLLETFLPCSPPNHVSVRNRLHRVARTIEAVEAAALPAPAVLRRRHKAPAEIVVMIDGGYCSGHCARRAGKHLHRRPSFRAIASASEPGVSLTPPCTTALTCTQTKRSPKINTEASN